MSDHSRENIRTENIRTENIRMEELALLYEAAELLGRTLDPAAIYSTLQTMVARVMDCASLLVSIYTPEDGLIRCAYACAEGQLLDPAAFPPLPLDQDGRGMQSQVIRSGQPLIIADALAAEKMQSSRFYAQSDGTVALSPDPSQARIQSLAIVPIALEGKVLGTAQVMSYRQDAYTQHHLRLLEALLIQVAAATRTAYLFQKMSAELAERRRVEAENSLLLAQARENALRQRAFLRDVLASVTDGRLQLCSSQADLPAPLPLSCEPVPLTQTSGLPQLRRDALAAAEAAHLPEDRRFDLVLATGEAGMNAVVHAGTGTGQVFWDPEQQVVQVRVEDQGEGILMENLPHATLKRGYSTKATLGHGMKIILETASRLWLLTGPTGTTVVLEQELPPPALREAAGWL